jgi:hypothetical protein
MFEVEFKETAALAVFLFVLIMFQRVVADWHVASPPPPL